MKQYIILLSIISLFILSSQIRVKHDGVNKEIKTYKFLFMYRYNEVRNDPKHKLNIFSYKNILLANDQITVFESTNDATEEPDANYDTTKYLITFRYDFLDLPCIGGIYLCNYSEFSKEYKTLYPEINYTIPKEITSQLSNPSVVSENCIVMPIIPILDVRDATWICHPNLEILVEFQFRLSAIIHQANGIDYSFVADYIQSKNTIHRGIVSISNSAITFNDLKKKQIYYSEWKEIEPYANSLYLKENIDFKGVAEKMPDATRCIKIYKKAEIVNNNPDYFCIYFQRNDATMKLKLQTVEARYGANMYTFKINTRMHKVLLKISLEVLAKESNKIEVDSKIMFPIKMEVRSAYLKQRHKLVASVKLGKMKRSDLDKELESLKEKIIDRSCGGIELCIKAIKFCIDNKLLPLGGEREKFAWDMQNPFNYLLPKTNIKIDLPKAGGMGEKIMSTVNKLLGGKNDYFAEKLPEAPAGNTPNHISLMKAVNTISQLRENREYFKLSELAANCKHSKRSNSNNIRRKISFLSYSGDNDVFFEYLGFVRDTQFSTK